MKIRQEKPAEYQAVERLTYQAFKELNLTENWRPTEHFIAFIKRKCRLYSGVVLSFRN